MPKLLKLNYQNNTAAIYDPLTELKRWGRYLNRLIYPDKSPASIFGVISEHGMSLGPVIYTESTIPDPMLLQTHRVWAFMPPESKVAIFLFYAMNGEAGFKARRMKVPRGTFMAWVKAGQNFYLRHRNTDFSPLLT